MEKDIKEVKELFKALNVLATTAGLVMKDGKVDLADMQHVVGLAMAFNTLKDGFANLDQALEELKDLDVEEVVEIIRDAFAAGDAYEASRKS